jgi:hypothetical protein
MEMDMLFRKIYGEIFSGMIYMSLFSHKKQKSEMKALYSELYLTRAIKTQSRALYRAYVPLDGATLPRSYHQMNGLQFLVVYPSSSDM